MIADIQSLKIRHESFWDQHEINYRQMEQPSVPYVVDPSFPENNYLAGMKPRVMQLFSNFAKVTLDRINAWKRGNFQVSIFENQPKWQDRTNGQGTNQPSNEVNEKFDSVYKELQQTISRDINGRQNQTWSLSSGQENHIASVTFPLNDGHNNAIQITFDFE